MITPAYNLKAKYIIHAVGPVWCGGDHHEPQLLYSAYKKSLELALAHGCHSIGFPLLSAGIFGYPADKAWRKALQACLDFQNDHPDDQIDVVFAEIDEHKIMIGEKTLQELTGTAAKSDQLLVDGKMYDAVFFHLPKEPNGYLSNWYPASFELDGIVYSSTEQYIMYRKCMLFGDLASAAAVLATNDPEEQQRIGKGAKGFVDPVWDGMKQMFAYRGLMAKFTQNNDLKQKLLGTGDAFLVECAHSDKIWACGIRLNETERFDISKWQGQNILGFTLMEVRNSIRAEEGKGKEAGK